MYGFHIRLKDNFDTALQKVTAALKDQGFGILSEIDIQQAMKEKLGVEMLPYRILGACNPPLAHRAIQAEPEIGLLLPCNVTVRQTEEGDISVGFLDAQMMVKLTANDRIREVADDASARLKRARDALAAG